MYQTLSTKYFHSLINASWEVAKKIMHFVYLITVFFMTGWKCANFLQLPMSVIYRFVPTAAIHTGISSQNLFQSTKKCTLDGVLGEERRQKVQQTKTCLHDLLFFLANCKYFQVPNLMFRSVWKTFWTNIQVCSSLF